jgi:hypothetical protein
MEKALLGIWTTYINEFRQTLNKRKKEETAAAAAAAATAATTGAAAFLPPFLRGGREGGREGGIEGVDAEQALQSILLEAQGFLGMWLMFLTIACPVEIMEIWPPSARGRERRREGGREGGRVDRPCFYTPLLHQKIRLISAPPSLPPSLLLSFRHLPTRGQRRLPPSSSHQPHLTLPPLPPSLPPPDTCQRVDKEGYLQAAHTNLVCVAAALLVDYYQGLPPSLPPSPPPPPASPAPADDAAALRAMALDLDGKEGGREGGREVSWSSLIDTYPLLSREDPRRLLGVVREGIYYSPAMDEQAATAGVC